MKTRQKIKKKQNLLLELDPVPHPASDTLVIWKYIKLNGLQIQLCQFSKDDCFGFHSLFRILNLKFNLTSHLAAIL